jgi:hypothetical protein
VTRQTDLDREGTMRFTRGIAESLIRAGFIALLGGGVFLLLQFYTEAEIIAAARRFWVWWSSIFTGDLAPYWNPVGAGVVLTIIVIFVLNPVLRLFRTRRSGGRYSDSDHHDYSSGDGGGDGGD